MEERSIRRCMTHMIDANAAKLFSTDNAHRTRPPGHPHLLCRKGAGLHQVSARLCDALRPNALLFGLPLLYVCRGDQF